MIKTLLTILILVFPLHAKEPQKASTQSLIQHLLDQDLGTRSFPFADVILAATGKQVIQYDQQIPAHSIVSNAITEAIGASLTQHNQPDSPIRSLRRINEASHYFEDSLLEYLNTKQDITCSIPKNTQGKEQRSGYPDLLITHTDNAGIKTYFYLDPKLYEKKSRASSLRTFYYEPRTRTNKIQYDATHLLIGISHDGNEGAWKFTGWDIVDLSTFNVRLKAEFQASNKDLYRPGNIIKSSE